MVMQCFNTLGKKESQIAPLGEPFASLEVSFPYDTTLVPLCN